MVVRNQHVIGIVLETDEEMILNLNELQRNTSVVVSSKASETVRSPDSGISLSVHRFISAEILPQSAMLQQSLCDSLVAWGARLDESKIERLRQRASASCKKPPPVVNQPEPLQLQREPIRVTTARLLQHDSYVKPDVYKFFGKLRFFRVDQLDTNDRHVTLPFVPATFPCDELLKCLYPFCSKKTIVVMLSEDMKQPQYYHALFSFKTIREAQEFSQQLYGQMIRSSDDESSETMRRYKFTPIPTRFVIAAPYVERIEAAGALEIPTCPACLSVLDETILNWPCTPEALESCKHSIGCPARISASYTYAHCSACEETEDLWLCMICGNVACSRYKRSHGINHCSCTGHSLTVKLSTFDSENPFVWDYVTDRCVQRLSAPLSDQETKALENVEESCVQKARPSPAAEEKKAMSILELNAMYTSALEHTDQIQEVMIRDLEETYRAAENALKSELEELKKRWDKNIGGQNGASQKLARRKEFLKTQEKNLEEEMEIKRCLEANLKEKHIKLAKTENTLKMAKDEACNLKAEIERMMAHMGMM